MSSNNECSYASGTFLFEINPQCLACGKKQIQQESPFSKVLVRIRFIFSRSPLKNNFQFLVLVPKHVIDRKICPKNEILIQISCYNDILVFGN